METHDFRGLLWWLGQVLNPCTRDEQWLPDCCAILYGNIDTETISFGTDKKHQLCFVFQLFPMFRKVFTVQKHSSSTQYTLSYVNGHLIPKLIFDSNNRYQRITSDEIIATVYCILLAHTKEKAIIYHGVVRLFVQTGHCYCTH